MGRGVGVRRIATESRAVSDLDAYVEVETPEQIAFSYSLAGIGSRAVAAAVDLILCVVVFVLLAIGIMYLAAKVDGTRLKALNNISDSWAVAIVFLVQFLIVWGYYVIAEGMFDGQSLGKRLLRLRVVRDGGYAVSFGASAIRNLFRAIDAQPFPSYLVAIVSGLSNKSTKRLGDLVAGTVVIREHKIAVLSEYDAGRKEGVRGAAPAVARPRLSDEEYALLERYMQRQGTFAPEAQQSLRRQLTRRLGAYLSNNEEARGEEALAQLYAVERGARRSVVAQRSDTGLQSEQHAIIAFGLKRWNEFARRLDRLGRGGLSQLQASQVSTFVAQYREISTDYARLRTASRGRPADASFFLSRLVGRAHSIVYRQRGDVVHQAIEYVFTTVPAEIRRSWRPIVLAACLLFGPAVASYLVLVTHPRLTYTVLPDEMMSRAKLAASREKRGEGYVTIEREARPIAASQIITNNVQVTYVSFAAGITLGIGTIYALVVNGVMLGSVLAVFSLYHVLRVVLAFILPHGVLELTAICFGAGGGLLIAAGILLPGTRTRREALVENGKRAIALVTGASVLLVVAGSIEGLISPRVWPMMWKVGVSALTAVALVYYLSLGARRTKVSTVMQDDVLDATSPRASE